MPRKLLLLAMVGLTLTCAWLYFGASWTRRSVATLSAGPNPFADKIAPDPPAAPLTFTPDRARLLHAQVVRGDLTGAAATFAEVLARSKMEAWQFYPMDGFMSWTTGAAEDAYLLGLNRWIESDASSDAPRILRAQYYQVMSWRVRGTRYVSKTPPEKTRHYYEFRSQAIAEINAAIALNDRDPYSFQLLLDADGTDAAFQRGIAKYPAYYPLYSFWLSRLEPKWGGSVAAMYEFTGKYAGAAPAGSPLKMLYLDLYDDLLGMARSSCSRYTGNDFRRCVAAAADQLVTKPLEDSVQIVAALHSKVDPFQFSGAMTPRLKSFSYQNGQEVRAAAILQTVADAMHGTTALVPDKGLSTFFMLDEAAGSVWLHAGNHGNAETLYMRALDDLKSEDAPDDVRRFARIGGTYDSLAAIYNASGQLEKALAARAMGARYANPDDGPRASLECEDLFKLNRLTEAVDACTRLLNVREDFAALRYRGKAYKALGMRDKALADLTAVAGSNDPYSSSAAIDLTLIYSDLGAYDKMVQVFSTYTDLFDEDEQTKNMIAVAYNNRCYAYLKLRQLKRALDDCEKSLRYDTIPDALQKKHEILAALESN